MAHLTQSTRPVGTVEDLEASAIRLTGLTDFGGDDHRAGLEVLLRSYAEDEALTERGSKVKRSELRGALAARLFSELGRAQHPEHRDVAIERPIFVTGLTRSGTTALHRLLAADPAHQGVEQWLCEMPQPRPPRDTWADDPVFRGVSAGFDQFYAANPGFAGVHYIAADTVEECWQLLRQSVMSVSYESLAHVPTYSAWLAGQDWTAAYRRHRSNLQLIGSSPADRGRRWVLKNPSHLVALEALFAVYPDAIVVQTHRDVRTIVASSCSLAAQATAGFSERFVGATIGADTLHLLGREADAMMAARDRLGDAQVHDVAYRDLVADPVGTVEAIYRRFDLPWTPAVRAAVAAEDAASRSGHRAPSHRYSLDDFGLTGAEVDDRLAAYTARHL